MIKTIATIILIFILMSFNNKATAFDDEDTHPRITKNAIYTATLESYLIQNLGLKDGLKTILPSGGNKSIVEWIQRGSTDEDDPNCRASNHFHNPLLSWNQSQMTDQPWWLDVACFDWKPWYSNITWATSYLSPPPDGAKVPFSPYSSYSPITWDRARDYYYKALTLTTQADRDIYVTWTFQAVGRVLHLLEDMAVPAHTRNDFTSHLIFNGITSLNPTKWFIQPFEHYVKMNPQLVATASPSTSDFPSFTNLRLTDFWDSNLYNGSNPSTLNDIGLAEFSNANYFSDSTIWNNGPSAEHTFPFPKVSNSEHQICIGLAPDGSEYRRYVSRLIKGNCPPIYQADSVDHFAAVSLLDDETRIMSQDISLLKFWLDDNVHNTYANELLPRAVGYSAGLLNYFFRGDIDLVRDDVTGTGYVIVNNADEDMNGTFELYYDDITDDQRKLYWTGTYAIGKVSSGNNKSGNIPIALPANARDIILVFRGTLGNEADAVVGKVLDKIYLIVMPLDHTTRQLTGKSYYSYNGSLAAVQETDLPFTLIDDGGYWDYATSSWTATTHPESLGVPLSVGGPQYIAKFKDDTTNTIRFVPNVSYEKNAYQDFHQVYTEEGTGFIKKDFWYVTFEGTPLMNIGTYEENPGYMEYMEDPDNPGTYGVYSLKPIVASSPGQRYFSEYHTRNFLDIFLEYDKARFYRFGGTIDEQDIPQDTDAPLISVASVSRSGDGFDVRIPKIFDYVQPVPGWDSSSSNGSSGVDKYEARIGASMNYLSSDDKCTIENNNCGSRYYTTDEPLSVKTIIDIPYNFNSYVRVHNNDGGQYYEELFINGQLRDTSPVSTIDLETHYQILAVYKDIAVVRETNFDSLSETPLLYKYRAVFEDFCPQIYEVVYNFTAQYAVYINGARYDLTGQTSVQSKLLSLHYDEDPDDCGLTSVYYLTFKHVEDITGYHLDRIFISDTFDGQNILVAFDEYSYNNGAGLVHDRKFEEDDLGTGKYFLFYEIPPEEIQGASHEALPVGRKLLLFKSDGALIDSLQDPIGLNYSIGSIGILN